MKRKWVLKFVSFILVLLIFTACTAEDPDPNNTPLENNNDGYLENNLNNEDRDDEFDNNLQNDMNLEDDNNLQNDPNLEDDNNLFEDETNENTNMP